MAKLLLLFLIYIISFVSSKQPKIIIVGAGPSGIAAATHLLENNFTDITILEAEPRIGGRIHTVPFEKNNVDLGAQWCHGEKGNIVYEKVKDLNLLEHSKLNEILVFSSNKNVSEEFGKKLMSIIKELDQEYCNNVVSNYNTLGDVCINSFNYSIHEAFEGNEEQINLALDAIEFYHLRSLGAEGAFSWFDISIKNDYITSEGDLGLNWKGKGYKMILDVLMRKYPDSSNALPIENLVLLNQEVNKIYWNESTENNVKIVCSDKSVHLADQLIFTPSIGVLKEQHQNMFEPALPLKKQEAIKNIGFGAVIKIWMSFSEKWWEDDVDFDLIWVKEDMEMAKSQFSEGSDINGRSWITYISDIQSEKHRPNLLLAWVVGDIVPSVELLPEEVIKDGLYFVLDKFLGDSYNITKPDQILHSAWHNNPHFRGTYSYQTLKTARREHGPSSEDQLGEPLRNSEGRPIVQFAGEATHPTYYSTVHGAIETGYREAKTLISLYK